MRPFFTILFAAISLASLHALPPVSYSPISIASVSEPMYYIHITESKNDREFFPKLYPIGFVIKELNPNNNKTAYFLGEFSTQQEANEALTEVKASGYNKAYIVQKN